jgi:MFS family permease
MSPIAFARRFVILGAALFFAGLTTLLLPLDEAHLWGWFSVRTLSLISLSLLLLAVFVRVELRTPEPMIDLRLFRNRTFTASTVSSVLNFMSMSAVLFLVPYYLILGRGFTPERAGVLLASLSIPMAMVAPFSGFLSDKIGTRTPAVLGMVIMLAGCTLLTRLNADTSLLFLAIGLGIAGVGTGVFISPNNSAIMGSANRSQQGIAAGVRATARNVGNVLGIGMAGAIFNNVLASYHTLPTGADISRAAAIGLLATVVTTALAALTSAMQSKG